MLAPRYRWQVASRAPDSLFTAFPAHNPLVVQLLYNRGYGTPAAIRGFFLGADAQEHDPYLLKSMDAAVDRILRAIRDGERIGIFGDYDTDGITAAVILSETLEKLGVRAIVLLPHRVEDGYGLTERVIESLAAQGVELLITVDCGISAVDPVAAAAERRMDVIITDHHQPPPLLARRAGDHQSLAAPIATTLSRNSAGPVWRTSSAAPFCRQPVRTANLKFPQSQNSARSPLSPRWRTSYPCAVKTVRWSQPVSKRCGARRSPACWRSWMSPA